MTRRTVHIVEHAPQPRIAVAVYREPAVLIDWREYSPTFSSMNRLAKVIESAGQLDNAFKYGLAMLDQD